MANSRSRRCRWAARVIGVAALLVLYVGILFYYGDSVRMPPAPPTPQSNLLTHQMRPQIIDVVDESLQTLITIHPPNNLPQDATQRLSRDLEVTFPLANQSFVL